MIGRLISLFVLITVVWQVISLIINQANAKKEREQMQAAARRRGRTASHSGTSQRPDETRKAPAPGRQSRLDELAARRQQQLEELRRRRTSASRGGSGTQADLRAGPAGAPTTSSPQQPSAPAPPARRTAPKGPGNVAASIEREAAARRQRAQEQRDRTLRERQASDAARVRAEAESKSSGPAPEPVPEPPSAYAMPEFTAHMEAFNLRPAAGPHELRALLADRASLRRAIVINELLGPPVGMRDPAE